MALRVDKGQGEGLLSADKMMTSLPVLPSGLPVELGLTSSASRSSPPRHRIGFSIELMMNCMIEKRSFCFEDHFEM